MRICINEMIFSLEVEWVIMCIEKDGIIYDNEWVFL